MNRLAIATIAAVMSTSVLMGTQAMGQAAVEPLTSDITKRLAEIRANYDQFVDAHVLKPHELAVATLEANYFKALEANRDQLSAKGDLGSAASARAELDRLGHRYEMPADDKDLPVGLRPLRATFRAELAKLEQDRDVNLRSAGKRYDTALGQYQILLAQAQSLEGAVHVKKLREALIAGGGVPERAPFVNSLGMKFVPVKGTQVLFCIHHTRYQDYAAYAAATPGVDTNWKSQRADGYTIAERSGEQPVVSVNWDEAQGFCAWLSKKEGKTYRLPTDKEWSTAAGIQGETWTDDTTPESVFKSQTGFPWGDQWPPPQGAGNYSDQSRKQKAPSQIARYIPDYDDGYPFTSPVMSFHPNPFGLYDMGGNAWQWCADFWNGDKKDGVLRGGAWDRSERALLLLSARLHHLPTIHSPNWGFRIVLASPAP